MKKSLATSLVLMFALWHSATLRGCGGSSPGPTNQMNLYTHAQNINLDPPFDQSFGPLNLSMDGEVTSDLEGASGSPSSVSGLVAPPNDNFGAPDYWVPHPFSGRVPANWRFKVSFPSNGVCYNIWAPAKPMIGGGIYNYTCPTYYSGGVIVGYDDPRTQSVDETGQTILDPNNIGELLDSNNQFMFPGDGLVSANGGYTLIYLSDGNLVEYSSSFTAVWMSWTSGSGGGNAHVHLQEGDLVIYNASTTPVFTTNTGGHSGAYMVCQNDGNIVIYDSGGTPLWSSGVP
jgi:hypothetical protein